MPKPKNKPNAFSVFCQDWKKKLEKQENRIVSMAEAMSNLDCNKAWRDLPEVQKTHYKTLAKNTMFPIEVDKKTGLGESLSEIERAKEKSKEFRDTMNEYISSITKSAKEANCIQKLKFYVIHTNYLYNRTLSNNEVEYYPAEICLAQCSLENGVEDVYHVLISDKILKGYRNDALSHSKSTHQIPVDFDKGKNNYQEIFTDLCKFLEPGKKNNSLPPLYTLMQTEDIYYPAKSILGKLSAADDKSEEYLRLYGFEDLFGCMYNAVLEQSGAIRFDALTAWREITKDPYGYNHGLECDFHKAIGAGELHCSQSKVKRWFYVLCDFCCDPLDIVKVPGVHTPLIMSDVHPLSRLNSSMSSLSLNDSKFSSTLNMTEVSNDYRMRSTGRSFYSEMHRKKETRSAPIQIIDHSKMTRKLPEVKERPLRLPFSKSTLIDDDDDDDDTLDNESIDYSENSFPSIGRGVISKKRTQEKKGSAGHGYANALKR